MLRPPDRVSVPLVFLVGLLGVVAGLVTFGTAAALWRSGDSRAASIFSQMVVLLDLIGMAAVTTLSQPARLRRARVPVNRAMPRAWWPAADPVPALAVWAGAPVMTGAAAAALFFR